MVPEGREKGKLLDVILDENQSPVARMRLFSDGVNQNTRILNYDKVKGDKGCLACGNCVDACPVIRENQRFVFPYNKRTSMALENMVGDECRRCYRCVNACPQVEKTVKEHVMGFRRGEKVIHLLIAIAILLLAFTGVTFSHYGDYLPSMEVKSLRYAHRTLGLFLIVTPFLYFIIDKRHMLRLFRRVFIWGKSDWLWIKDLVRHIGNHKKYPMPKRVQFNAGQKAWYLFVIVLIPVMSVTGIILLIAIFYPDNSFFGNTRLIHMGVALVSDILLLLHIYIKYLRNWGILTFDIIKVYREKKHLVYPMLYSGAQKVS